MYVLILHCGFKWRLGLGACKSRTMVTPEQKYLILKLKIQNYF